MTNEERLARKRAQDALAEVTNYASYASTNVLNCEYSLAEQQVGGDMARRFEEARDAVGDLVMNHSAHEPGDDEAREIAAEVLGRAQAIGVQAPKAESLDFIKGLIIDALASHRICGEMTQRDLVNLEIVAARLESMAEFRRLDGAGLVEHNGDGTYNAPGGWAWARPKEGE